MPCSETNAKFRPRASPERGFRSYGRDPEALVGTAPADGTRAWNVSGGSRGGGVQCGLIGTGDVGCSRTASFQGITVSSWERGTAPGADARLLLSRAGDRGWGYGTGASVSGTSASDQVPGCRHAWPVL
jgi:hypothetical protein